MKINLRLMGKRLGFIFFIFSFLVVAETAVSKGIVQQAVTIEVPEAIVQPVIEQKKVSLVAGQKLSLEQIHAQEQGGITRGAAPGAPSTSDKFTQTQALMSLPEIKKLIDLHYNIKPYQKMIDAIVDREKECKDDYDVFYHGLDNEWRVPQDLYTRLYVYFKKLPENILQQFIFLRFGNVVGSSTVQGFLVNKLKENGLINDHELGDFLYAVNLSLFGNVGTDPECTWQYFMKSRGHAIL